jgi:hypothetical protein
VVSAATVADVIGRIDGTAWMPRIKSWEIATTDGVWGAHGELDAEGSVTAMTTLAKFAGDVGSEITEATERLVTVDFVFREVPVRVWWLRPIQRWVIPETCATCPTKLGDPGVRFVRLGEGDREAAVICVPCRDRMQAEWVAAVSA